MRSNVRKGLNEWSSADGVYGAVDAQLKSLNGKRLTKGLLRQGDDDSRIGRRIHRDVDKIPALHNIKLAGVKDFVVPESKNVFGEMEHERWCSLRWLPMRPTSMWVWLLGAVLLIRCEDERTEALLRRITGQVPRNMLTAVAWTS